MTTTPGVGDHTPKPTIEGHMAVIIGFGFQLAEAVRLHLLDPDHQCEDPALLEALDAFDYGWEAHSAAVRELRRG